MLLYVVGATHRTATHMCRHIVTLPTNNIFYKNKHNNEVNKTTVKVLLMGFSKLVFLLIVGRGTLYSVECDKLCSIIVIHSVRILFTRNVMEHRKYMSEHLYIP